MAGLTNSTNFPTASAAQASLSSGTCTIRISYVSYNLNCPDAFLAELDPLAPLSSIPPISEEAMPTSLLPLPSTIPTTFTWLAALCSSGLATAGAFQTMLGSKGDAFVFKVAASAAAPPTFTLTPATAGGSTSATVKAGQTGTYNLQINPTGGFTGTVNFTCGGAPAQATCSPTSPVSVTGTAAVPFTVTVNTTAASAVPPVLWRIPITRVPVWVWPFAFLLLAVLVLASQSRFAVPKWRTPVLWAATLFIFAFSLLVGCGSGGGNNGGNGGNNGNSGTPVGTYTITLTGTSGSVSQNLSLTLTVQ